MMVCFITQRTPTNFRMNCAWNYEGYSVGQLFKVVCASFCQGTVSRLTITFLVMFCEHKRERMGFCLLFFFSRFHQNAWLWEKNNNNKKLNLSRPASGGLMFSPDFLKNVSMLNINSCELLSHILLFPTFLPELKRLHRILRGYFHHFSVQCSELLNNWGLGCNASYCFHSLYFPLTKQL